MVKRKAPLDEESSFIEEKATAISRELGIQKEALFRTTFEEIEEKLAITDESIFEFKSPKMRDPERIKGSIFAHFASPLFKKDIVKKQKLIDKFINDSGMGT